MCQPPAALSLPSTSPAPGGDGSDDGGSGDGGSDGGSDGVSDGGDGGGGGSDGDDGGDDGGSDGVGSDNSGGNGSTHIKRIEVKIKGSHHGRTEVLMSQLQIQDEHSCYS